MNWKYWLGAILFFVSPFIFGFAVEFIRRGFLAGVELAEDFLD